MTFQEQAAALPGALGESSFFNHVQDAACHAFLLEYLQVPSCVYRPQTDPCPTCLYQSSLLAMWIPAPLKSASATPFMTLQWQLRP